MRKLALVMCLGLVPGIAFGQTQPQTSKMFCGQARDLVNARGGITLATGPTTYDRFVSGQNQCYTDQMATPAFVPTRDFNSCFIGYRCVEKSPSR